MLVGVKGQCKWWSIEGIDLTMLKMSGRRNNQLNINSLHRILGIYK